MKLDHFEFYDQLTIHKRLINSHALVHQKRFENRIATEITGLQYKFNLKANYFFYFFFHCVNFIWETTSHTSVLSVLCFTLVRNTCVLTLYILQSQRFSAQTITSVQFIKVRSPLAGFGFGFQSPKLTTDFTMTRLNSYWITISWFVQLI